jgi:hypothetical protein
VSSSADVLALLAKHEPVAMKIGLTRDQVLAATAKFRPVAMPTPEEARRGLARMIRRQRFGLWGRNGLPEHVWRAMYAEYCSGKSLAQVAAIFGGSRQSVHEVFTNRKLRLRPRCRMLHDKIEYNGVGYTPGKDGYYRATVGDRGMLHHRMWEDANGPIPEGWQVTFKNADHTDLRLDNMCCMPIAAVTLFHHARHQATRSEAL